MHHVTLWLHSLAAIIVGVEACHSSRELPRKQSCNRHPRPALNDGSWEVDPCLPDLSLKSGHTSTQSKLNEPELCLVWVRYGPQPDCYLGWQNQEVNYCMVYAPAVQLDWIGAIMGSVSNLWTRDANMKLSPLLQLVSVTYLQDPVPSINLYSLCFW